MRFQIAFENKNYNLNLGPSQVASEAYRGVDVYKQTSNYGDLRRLFANLSWIISEGNPFNKQACLATQVLALSVFPTLNEYQKLFVAISVTSAYEKAHYPVPADWARVQVNYGNIIRQNYNEEKALDAGLASINLESKEVIVRPIPEYSIIG